MSILILHLSDFHIASGDDTVATRHEAITRAVKDVDYAVSFCVVVVSGDLAYSGQEDEYLVALEFLTVLLKELGEALPGAAPRLVMIPGNHDCDVTGSQQARGLMVAAMQAAPDLDPHAAMVDVCTNAQSEFFELRDALAFDEPPTGDRLYFEYAFEVDEGVLLFRCYNTAWLSTKGEQPGTLVYPVQLIPKERREAAALAYRFEQFEERV